MARMFPATLSKEIRDDPMRSGEIRVYRNLETQLPEDFDVYYSSPWLATRDDGSEVDGECDFLIAHPVHGLLTIEVKGGRVSIDADNRWKSTDRHGFTRFIKNPVGQARSAKHSLIGKLRESHPRWVTGRHGVILPHTKRPRSDRDLRPDAPLKIFAFEEDMDSLAEWVNGRLSAPEDGGESPSSGRGLGVDGILALEKLLARPIQLHDRLRPYIRDDLEQIETLTQEQHLVIQSLSTNKRVAIAGAAGTGKTVLAIEKSMRLADEGKRVLLLCFNAPLGAHLRNVVRQEHNIWAGTFHSFWREIELKSATSSDRSPVDFKNLSDEEQTEVFLANLGDLDEEEFDALIIDEGQDFHSSWLEALELAVKDRGKGVVYMFHDNNQSVVPRSGSYIAKLDYFDFRLIKNLRNTRAIFRVVDRFYQSAEPVIPQGPQGSDVMWNPCKDVSEVRKLLVERTGYLINHHGLSPEEIAVLVPAQKMIEEIVPGGRLANHPIRSAEDFDGTGPIVDSIRRFKGLESTAVILVLTNSIRGEQEVLYTAVSRPRAILEVLAPRALINEIRTGLEEGA